MTTVYVAMDDRILVVDDATGVPSADERLRGSDVQCLEAVPEAPDRVFVGTFESGLVRSEDGGRSFERVGADTIEQTAVMSVAASPHDPQEVWVGTEPSRIYRSTDGGDSWERVPGLTDLPSESEWAFPPRPYTHHARWIEHDPADPETTYVGIEAGALVVTRDGGETWEERPPGSRRDNHTLATHPDAEGRVYSAAGDGYAESDDHGRSWDHPQDGLEHRYVWGLAVDPGDPDTVLVSSATGARTAHRQADSYLYRKGANGSWERLDDRGIPTGEGVLRAVLSGGRETGELYAVTNRGLYRTADGGDSWDRIGIEWPDGLADVRGRGVAVVP